jgi:glucokinase
MKKKVALGIDIGGTNTALGLADEQGQCFDDESFPTWAHQSFARFFERLAEKIDRILANLPHECEMIGIGVAAPAGNYFQGTIDAPSNFNWGKVEMVRLMTEYYHLPVAVTNDANAAALGEMMYGQAKCMQNFIVVTLGTGLGSGIVVNGNLIYGHGGLAGELGHTIIEPDGRQCACGRRGCLEMYASSRGICRTVFELLARRLDDSELRQISFNELTAEKVYEAAQRDDALAREAFEYTGRILGRALADAVACFGPEVIILFGGLAKAGPLLFEPVQRHFDDNLLHIYKGKVKIVPASVSKCSIAVLGACALIQKEIEKINPAALQTLKEPPA